MPSMALQILEALCEYSQQDAIAAAVKEVEDLISSGANIDTRHEIENMVSFIAQKHGISPDIIRSRIKQQPRKSVEDFDRVIRKAWDLTFERLPHPIAEKTKHLKLKIEDRDPEDPNLDGISYGDPTEGFIMYREGAEVKKGRISDIMQILAHEIWHVYEEYADFYTNLGRILRNKSKVWNSYGIKDVQEFISFLDMVEYGGISTDFMRRLKQKIIDRKFWGEAYFLDEVEEWEMKKIFKGITSRTFMASIDELMAESLGRIVAGKSLFVPRKFIDFILRMG